VSGASSQPRRSAAIHHRIPAIIRSHVGGSRPHLRPARPTAGSHTRPRMGRFGHV
jgi:hypothetical protein